MKFRAFTLTIGMSLALLAPAAHAAKSPRGLQSLMVGDGAASCQTVHVATHKAAAPRASNSAQVRRDSL